ncbi:MAG TPA: glycosyltransferase [Verrucomicrobiae bacterium]
MNCSDQRLPHLSVCICTYKRADLLRRLLDDLANQKTDNKFDYSIVVVDNDLVGSARDTVQSYHVQTGRVAAYEIEPVQNISMARNRAIALAGGDYVVFIDDDEFPGSDWLLTLYNACITFGVDGVLGPVKPHFDVQPPSWVIKGGFYDRASYPTGHVIGWRQGRTGNTLLKKSILKAGEEAFCPKFVTGEDQDFFRRMIERGHRFIWCEEALAHETVPPIRWNKRFMLRRALLRGKISTRHASFGFREILKSIVALPSYLVLMPLSLVVGTHLSMKFLVSFCDHAGKLLAWLHLDFIADKYVTE